MARRERLLDQDSGDPVVRFAVDLRALRLQAGNPTYRTLAERAGLSASTLAAAASGRGLPTLATTHAYVRACGGDVEAWEQRWRGLAPVRATRIGQATEEIDGAVDDDTAAAPYLGLAAFEPGDADRFFGRAEATAELVARVADQRLVSVFGASGSGKSSLLRAGLAARWAGNGGRFLVMTPGEHPLHTYQAALLALPDRADVRTGAVEDALVVVDQFEEVFTLCTDETERRRFIGLLLEAAHQVHSHVRVVLGVRTDFYSHCAHDPGLAHELQHSQFLVRPMTTEQLRAVITRPATQAGAMVETALVNQILVDCAGQRGVLPLLSHALRETWQRRGGATMTLSGYQAAGGIGYAIAQTAEQVYRSLSEREQRLARALFLRLVVLGVGTEDTKRRFTTTELDLDDPRRAATLARLTAARLVTVDHDQVELTHEALIRHWPRLARWLNDDRDGLRVHRQLTTATAIWNSLGQDATALYRGVQLSLACQWAAKQDDLLASQEREFLTRSMHAENQLRLQARQRTRRLRVLVALLSVLVVVAGTFAAVAMTSVRALTQQRSLVEAQDLLDRAATVASTDPVLAADYSVVAYRLFPEPQTRSGMLNYASPAMVYEWGDVNGGISPAFSPDGRVMAIADPVTAHVGWTHLWDVSAPTSPFALLRMPGTGVGQAMVFAPHGHLLATTSGPGMLWDDSNMSRLRPLSRVSDVPLTFSPDGRLLVGTQGVWDVSRPGRPRRVLTFAESQINGLVSFSPNGDLLAVAGRDPAGASVDLWDLRNPGRPRLAGHVPVPATQLAFLPHVPVLATITFSGTVQLWDVGDPARPRTLSHLTGLPARDQQLIVSPDGHTLALAGDDSTTELWDVANPRQPTFQATLTGGIPETFDPTAGFLAVLGTDGSIQLRDIDTTRVLDQICWSTASLYWHTWTQYAPSSPYQPCAPRPPDHDDRSPGNSW